MTDANTPITVKSTFDSLKAAGYPQAYIKRFLPDWWDNSLLKTSTGSFQFALILKQRLGLEVSFGQDGALEVAPQAIQANFKHRADTSVDELTVVASLGIALTRMVQFVVREPYLEMPNSPTAIYRRVRELSGRSTADFEGLLELCWSHGIPVLFLNNLPNKSKRMTGMAVKVENRPAIILGFNYSNHSRQLFVLAHELAHIVCGHVKNNDALVDEDLVDVTEGLEGRAAGCDDDQEKEADNFALSLIRNGEICLSELIPRQASASALALTASKIGAAQGVDPGHLIISYAKEQDDWIRANQALNFIEHGISAVDLLRLKFEEFADLTEVSDDNARHILTMQGI